jgi:hypothetical protein
VLGFTPTLGQSGVATYIVVVKILLTILKDNNKNQPKRPPKKLSQNGWFRNNLFKMAFWSS